MFGPRVFILASTLFLAACPDPNTALTAPPDPEQLPDTPRTPSVSCELKNGPTGCIEIDSLPGEGQDTEEGSAADAAAQATAAQRQREQEQNAAICRYKNLSWADLDRYHELYLTSEYDALAFCAQAEDDTANAPRPGSEPVVEGYSEPAAAGGGCEYQGVNYGPGDFINAPIDSSSLRVFGELFDNLAGKSGPWQQCQCSSSSGHWGCV